MSGVGFKGDQQHDGVWLLHWLRATSPTPPTIALTGRKEREAELLKLGFGAVMIKPLDAMNLVAIVEACLAEPTDVTGADKPQAAIDRSRCRWREPAQWASPQASRRPKVH